MSGGGRLPAQGGSSPCARAPRAWPNGVSASRRSVRAGSWRAGVSLSTTIACRDVLSQLWLLDPVVPWSPIAKHFVRLAGTPQHHLADPATAARLLGLDAASLLEPAGGRPGLPRARVPGALFESLVTLCVRVYAQHSTATVGHLRTRNGDHEVEPSATVEDRDVRHLRWSADHLGEDLLDAVVPAALPGP